MRAMAKEAATGAPNDQIKFRLESLCGERAPLGLVYSGQATMSTEGEEDLRRLNPFMADPAKYLQLVTAQQMHSLRVKWACYGISFLTGVLRDMHKLQTNGPGNNVDDQVHEDPGECRGSRFGQCC